jgi:hypothetical protein
MSRLVTAFGTDAQIGSTGRNAVAYLPDGPSFYAELFSVDKCFSHFCMGSFQDPSESLTGNIHAACRSGMVQPFLVGKPYRLELVDGQHNPFRILSGHSVWKKAGHFRDVLHAPAIHRSANTIVFHTSLFFP